jgi:hypothetical protein
MAPRKRGQGEIVKRAIWILWPSFIVAGLAEVVFFTIFDPIELHLVGHLLGVSRIAAYTLGFILFWLFAAASSAFTCFLQRGASEINRL